MLFNSPFKTKDEIIISDLTKVIFVSDLFVEDYVGGAELTTDALIQKCKYPYQKIRSKDVTIDILEKGRNAFWVFGNFSSLDINLIPTIVANLSYSVLEYDYKYCRYRSPEKHKYAENIECDCHQQLHGKLISAFYMGAKWLFWMSENQMNHYFERFPFLSDSDRSPGNTVLSSVFDDDFFVTLKKLEQDKSERKGWIVLGSTSWIKGLDQAEKWCKDNEKEYEIVWNLPYEEMLVKLSRSLGVVYLPRGMDTCPRFVIESKLLGCELVINDLVQHSKESWFDTSNLLEIQEYLYAARDVFWNTLSEYIQHEPEISGYVTTKDCLSQGYPIKECIESMQQFCDEVVVVDGGSTDGTFQMLFEMFVLSLTDEEKIENELLIADLRSYHDKFNKDTFETYFKPSVDENGNPGSPIKLESKKFKLSLIPRDWDDSRFAVFDGAQKAEARKLCTKEFCWQMDADEIVSSGDGSKIKELCKKWPQLAELISLPVVEFWGSKDKVRIDVNPWKWRISKNLPYITHGIPKELRQYDEDGKLFSLPGSDGCDYIHAETYERISHMCFYGEDAHNARYAALNGNKEALSAYETWMKSVVQMLPVVEHYSWMDIERKIKTYKNFWSSHWRSLYNIEQLDTPENNMFFDKSWKDVTDEDIHNLAKQLSEKLGGHVFHSKINWNNPTPSIKI